MLRGDKHHQIQAKLKMRLRLCLTSTLFLLGGISSSSLYSQTQTPAADGSGKVQGRVLTQDGRGLPQAAVFLLGAGSDIGTMRWTNSDAAGKFQFDSVSSGAYHLSAAYPGYVMAEDPMTGKAESLVYYPGDFANLSIMKGGVITGTVTDAAGNPAIGAQVTAIPLERKPRELFHLPFPFTADDRGVFRIYGLHPGIYHIRAGSSESNYLGSAYDGLASSFYSVKGDGTPTSLEVRAGLEISGIDIRLQQEFGHAIRGEVAISPPLKSSRLWANLHLIRAENGILEKTVSTSQEGSTWKFSFSHILDGNYYLLALTGFSSDPPGASNPVLISVHGQDISNIKPVLNPLGMLAGRVLLQPAETAIKCPLPDPALMKRLVVSTLRLSERKEKNFLESFLPTEAESVPDSRGEFRLTGLSAGNHFLRVHIPSPTPYLKSILPAAIPKNGTKTKTSRLLFPIQGGQSSDPIEITLAQGASEISGKVMMAEGVVGGLNRLRIFLVPADREAADNLLRYAETRPDRNGGFSLRNIAPGDYRLFVLP
jgi:hypothetical protein